jgi:hypothetical protein
VISTIFLFLFSFFSVCLFLVGIYSRSPVVIAVAGVLFLFTGLMIAVSGVYEYDGSYNSTYNYTDGNLTGQSQLPNYTTSDGTITQGIGSIFALMGVAMVYYGATIPKPAPE